MNPTILLTVTALCITAIVLYLLHLLGRRQLRTIAHSDIERRQSTARPALHRRVVVSLDHNEREVDGIDGLLTEYAGDYLRLEDARWLRENQTPIPILGSALVPRDRVVVMQEPPAETA